MEFLEFVEEVKKAVKNRLSNGEKVETISVYKNNQVKRSGIIIKKGGKNISQTIYLEAFFDGFLEYEQGNNGGGEDFIEKTAKEIWEQYQNDLKITDIDQKLIQWNYAKKNLYCKVINWERNKEKIQEMPHIHFLNLAVIFYVRINLENGTGNIEVRTDLLKSWGCGVSIEVLLNIAEKNIAKKEPFQIRTMEQIVKEITGDNEEIIDWKESMKREDAQMLVVSNKGRCYGAAAFLDRALLNNISKELQIEKLYILPSSVHELIVLTNSNYIENSLTEILRMVKEVNSTQVSEEEYLADNVYVYDAKKDEIMIAA